MEKAIHDEPRLIFIKTKPCSDVSGIGKGVLYPFHSPRRMVLVFIRNRI